MHQRLLRGGRGAESFQRVELGGVPGQAGRRAGGPSASGGQSQGEPRAGRGAAAATAHARFSPSCSPPRPGLDVQPRAKPASQRPHGRGQDRDAAPALAADGRSLQLLPALAPHHGHQLPQAGGDHAAGRRGAPVPRLLRGPRERRWRRRRRRLQPRRRRRGAVLRASRGRSLPGDVPERRESPGGERLPQPDRPPAAHHLHRPLLAGTGLLVERRQRDAAVAGAPLQPGERPGGHGQPSAPLLLLGGLRLAAHLGGRLAQPGPELLGAGQRPQPHLLGGAHLPEPRRRGQRGRDLPGGVEPALPQPVGGLAAVRAARLPDGQGLLPAAHHPGLPLPAAAAGAGRAGPGAEALPEPDALAHAALHHQGLRHPERRRRAARAQEPSGRRRRRLPGPAGEAQPHEKVPEPAQQDAAARAALRLPRRVLRPPLLALRRAHPPHPHPHGPEALPVPHLHAQLQPERPPHHPHPHPHRREALRLRHLRPQVRPLRRAQAPHQDPPPAEGQEGRQGPGPAAAGRRRLAPGPLQRPDGGSLLPLARAGLLLASGDDIRAPRDLILLARDVIVPLLPLLLGGHQLRFNRLLHLPKPGGGHPFPLARGPGQPLRPPSDFSPVGHGLHLLATGN